MTAALHFNSIQNGLKVKTKFKHDFQILVERPKRKFRRSVDGATRSEAGLNIAREPSEEYDTWSEPDVGASRTRMGLSRHVLALIERTGHSMRYKGRI